MAPDAILSVCRFLHDASAMLLFGGFGFIATFVPYRLAAEIGRRLRHFRGVAVAAAIMTTAAALPLEAAIIGDGWSDAADPAMIGDVLTATSFGAAWQVQAVAALLLAATLLAPANIRSAATALAAGLLLATLALTGHAVQQESWPRIAHQANDVLHVWTAGAWLGALVPLVAILGRLGDPAAKADAATALRRFSNAGHGVVALVVLSGLVNTLLIVGGLPTGGTFPYQTLLAAKIAVVALMAAVAIANRYVFVPWIGRRRAGAIEAIRIGTLAEIGLGLGAVALVAVFGMMAPN